MAEKEISPLGDRCEIIDDASLSDIDDDQFSFDDDDDTEENSRSTFIINNDDTDTDNSSAGIDSADLNRDGSPRPTWGTSSWTLTESMDSDHFFLVPPSRDLHMSRSSPRRQFVLSSSSVRRSGSNTFPISPPTRETLEASRLPPSPPMSHPATTGDKETNPREDRALRAFEASLRPPTTTELCTSSPTGVATYSLNRNDARRIEPPATTSTPTSKNRVMSRQDSLTYSIGQSVGHSTGGASSGRSNKNASTGGIVDRDEGDSILFRNLYEDDQSLYLDEDCLTECADPHYKSNRAFVTSDEAQNASATSPKCRRS